MAIIIGQLWLRFVIFLIFRNVKCAGYVRSDDLSQLLGGERNQKKNPKCQVPRSVIDVLFLPPLDFSCTYRGYIHFEQMFAGYSGRYLQHSSLCLLVLEISWRNLADWLIMSIGWIYVGIRTERSDISYSLHRIYRHNLVNFQDFVSKLTTGIFIYKYMEIIRRNGVFYIKRYVK